MKSRNYASVRVRADTYRELKKAAVDEGVTFTSLIDRLLEAYTNERVKAALKACVNEEVPQPL